MALVDIDISEIEQRLMHLAENTETAVSQLALSGALEMENYAKANRPWTDRTSQARLRLKGSVEHQERTKWDLVLSHGVDYGVFLEFAHERKYAIIFPTIQIKAPDIMRSFSSLMDEIKGSEPRR